MTDSTNGIIKKFLDFAGAQGVTISHCIIHRENLCTTVLAFAEVMKNVVQWENYIRDVVTFSAVRWLSRVVTLERSWNLRQEMKLFMESKHQNVAFFSDEHW